MWFLYIFFLILFTKFYKSFRIGWCRSDASMMDKVVIITGANSGIGLETAKELARRDATVYLACRNEERGLAARGEIIHETGNQNVFYKQLDLTSMKSVRAFAAQMTKEEPMIDILINNAGTGKLDNSLTEDNLPIEMQVNHFAPFLLTKLLLPRLMATAPSRIIIVASVMHWLGNIDFDKMDKPAESFYRHMKVYSDSKLANVLMAKELHRQLKGTGVTVNCCHPGAVNTEIFRNQTSIIRWFIKKFFKTPREGAQTTLHLAIAPELEEVSGKYFADCEACSVSRKANDEQLAKKLWEFSDRIVSNLGKN